MDRYELVRASAGLARDAMARGVCVSVSEDFQEFADLNDQLPERGRLTPMFDPRHAAIAPGRGFWVKGTNDAGEVVHVQAVRCDGVEDSLSNFFESWLVPLYEEAGDSPVPDRQGLTAAPVCRDIRGQVAYHGELWIKGRARAGIRGMSEVLPRFALLHAALAWPEMSWIYGLVQQRSVFSGITARWGYTVAEPNALCWDRPPRDEPLREWIVAASQAALANMIGEQAVDVMEVAQSTAPSVLVASGGVATSNRL